MIHAPDPSAGGGDDEVLGPTIDVEEHVSGPSTGAGFLGAGAHIADPVPDKRRRVVRKARDEELSAHVVVRLLRGLDFDDAVLHVHMEIALFATRHRYGELGGSIAIPDSGPESLLDRVPLVREQRLG